MPLSQSRRVLTPWLRPGVDRNRSKFGRSDKTASRKGRAKKNTTERSARESARAQDKLARKPPLVFPTPIAGRRAIPPPHKMTGVSLHRYDEAGPYSKI